MAGKPQSVQLQHNPVGPFWPEGRVRMLQTAR